MTELKDSDQGRLTFHGGLLGALLPFVFFLTGTVVIALSGAPDERGLWPVLLLALGVGLLLAKDRYQFSEVLIQGMSQKIIMIMITAWMLASAIGVLMTRTGLVEALIWLSMQLDLGTSGFVLGAFLTCSLVSLSTGSSFATILICSPLLYPSGGIVGVHPPYLAGAILAGATFGDFAAPISDTTIASALSQEAKIGPTVKSRMKYAIPIAAISGLLFFLLQWGRTNTFSAISNPEIAGDPSGWPMLLVPALVIFLFLRGKHLVHGLLAGLLFGTLVGLITGLLPVEELFALDLDNFRATSFLIDGINRAVGISFFTILLMGLVETLKANGIFQKLIKVASRRANTSRETEGWIAAVTSVVVLLTTHSIVAILTVKEFVNGTGAPAGVHNIRRANIMSMVVCFFPFVLPYFIPVILMTNMTRTGQEFGIPQLSTLEVGVNNFVAWGLIAWLLISVIFRFGADDKY